MFVWGGHWLATKLLYTVVCLFGFPRNFYDQWIPVLCDCFTAK
jgi:hypothetical protein